MIIQIYTTNNAKNVQKVLAAKLELFMEILCDNKSIPKTFFKYVWKPFHPCDNAKEYWPV